ncbi:MAG: 1-acyl-sn-glycerol-3-phosphate acyltransferase [Clostridia bacterium]|nr:1-acyl-sn-glycerol-3-phosphate acyltransferase [Clostridia bacterium]
MKKFFKDVSRGFIKGAIYIYCKIVYRVKIIGLENVPKDEQFIFCANHRTYLDPPLIEVTAKRHIIFLAKEELAKNKFLALLGEIFDVIYVKRDEKDITAIKTTLKTLKDNKSIALFPEGTRNGLEKGEDLKDGTAFFAIKSKVKVLPIGISGEVKPFNQVTIRYGKPLDLSEYTDVKDKDTLEKVTNKIMEEIKLLVQQPNNKI